jgi:hypothetical protein
VICLQDLVTTNLFYVAEKGSENLLPGIVWIDHSTTWLWVGRPGSDIW